MELVLSGPQWLQVYIHCTAGLGRAPAACIAWMYWFGDMQLDEVGAHGSSWANAFQVYMSSAMSEPVHCIM